MADEAVILTAWRRDDDQDGRSVARVQAVPGGWRCHGAEVLVGPDLVLACRFTVELDARWHTRTASVEVVADEVRAVELTCDGEGRWTRDGVDAPDLAGCVDVDVAATPLTNTFPLRRLGHLRVGETVTLAVAWVDVPSVRVHRVEQRYTRLGERQWRYGDDAHGGFDLTVDDDAVVVDYTGFAARVVP